MSIVLNSQEYQLPAPLPQNWRSLPQMPNAWRSRKGLAVMCSIENRDGDDWLHVSFSKKIKGKPNLPDYHDIAEVKRLFVGSDRNAYMVFPKADNHVNLHPNCLHLWVNLSDPQPLPEFSNEVLGIKAV